MSPGAPLAHTGRSPAPALLPKPGDVIGRKYRVTGWAASGGMAAILSAEHLVLGQRVAVKVMLAESVNDARAVERFLREAQAASRLESEHVARVMDAGVLDSGLPYLVMEYLEGRDLGALLAADGRLPCEKVADYALEALEGLAHAHAAGIVHRDLKPSNLFVARRPDASEVLKLLDFGISKSLTDAQDECAKTLTGNAVVGSPVYMSPEQVRCARTVDIRSDFWSLGVTVYELLTGAVPFDGECVGEVLARILDGEPQPLRDRRPSVPPGLQAIVAKCLEPDREDRYQDAGEMARAIAELGAASGAQAVARIEATLLNAPLTRAPTSLGGVRAIRTTVVETAAQATAPTERPPKPDASGDFALSRTRVDSSTGSRAWSWGRRGRPLAAVVGATATIAIVGSVCLAGSPRHPPVAGRLAQDVAPAPAPPAAQTVEPPASSSTSVLAPTSSSTVPPRRSGPTLGARPAFLRSRK